MNPLNAHENMESERASQPKSSPPSDEGERIPSSHEELDTTSARLKDLTVEDGSDDSVHLESHQDTVPETEDWSPTEHLLLKAQIEQSEHLPHELSEEASGGRHRDLSWGAWGLVVSMLVVYQLSSETSLRGLNTQEALIWGANYPPQVIGPDAEWWRLITAAFLHWDLSHLIFNLVVLFWLGRELERLLGFLGFLTLFLCCSTLAGVATLFYYPEQMSLGASGGIYGLVGAMIILSVTTRGERLNNAKRQSGLIAVWLIISLLINVDSPWVDTASHIGGGCSGILLGLFLAPLYAVKTLRPIHAWLCRVFGVGFTIFTVGLALTMTPPIQPIFTFLKKYSVHASTLREGSAQMVGRSPLERRAWWEAEGKPKIDELERSLLLISDLSNLDPSELDDVSSATQWSLWRLLNSWKTYLGREFTAQNQGEMKTRSALPPRVALRLYEALILEQKTAQLLNPAWDERVTALRRFSLWRDLPRARDDLSQLSADLVSEADSAEVRERGSLWGDRDVREARFNMIVDALSAHPPLTLQDHLTLAQIAWVRGDLPQVIERAQRQLRSLQLRADPELKSKVHPKLMIQAQLTQLWLKALRSKLYTLERQFNFSLSEHGQLHSEGDGGFPRSSVMYLLAQSCQPSSNQPRPRSWLIELFVPQDQGRSLSVTAQPISIQTGEGSNREAALFYYHGKPQRRPMCLDAFRLLGWRVMTERDNTQRMKWHAYALD